MGQAIFKDSRGNVVYAGDRIKIIHDYNHQFRNGKEGVVVWYKEKGMYRFKLDDEITERDFYGIHEFEKITPK